MLEGAIVIGITMIGVFVACAYDQLKIITRLLEKILEKDNDET